MAVARERRVSYVPTRVHRVCASRTSRTACGIAVVALCACRAGTPPARAAEPVATTAPPPPSYTNAPPLDAAPGFVDQQLGLRASESGSNLRPVGVPMRGVLTEGASADHAFDAMAGHCYRVLGASGVEADAIDLALYAPDGTEIDSDTHGDHAPVLGATRPLCPPVGGRYRVEVRMVRGQGDYGLQVMATP